MNKEHLQEINRLIKQKGDEIQPILPPLPSHPVRQAQAHLYREIKLRFGVPVAELGDHRFEEVLRLIQVCVDNAADPDIKQHLLWVVPEPPKANLEDFFEMP